MMVLMLFGRSRSVYEPSLGRVESSDSRHSLLPRPDLPNEGFCFDHLRLHYSPARLWINQDRRSRRPRRKVRRVANGVSCEASRHSSFRLSFSQSCLRGRKIVPRSVRALSPSRRVVSSRRSTLHERQRFRILSGGPAVYASGLVLERERKRARVGAAVPIRRQRAPELAHDGAERCSCPSPFSFLALGLSGINRVTSAKMRGGKGGFEVPVSVSLSEAGSSIGR